MRTLVTGANGFVGNALVTQLVTKGHEIRSGVRKPRSGVRTDVQSPDLTPGADWSALLNGVDALVHTAARVHVMNDSVQDPLQAFRYVNTEGTLALARQAAHAGVKRFVFVSSIKVNGEYTLPGQPFVVDVPSPPLDPYGLSKYEAENGLRSIALETGMEFVIVRPPLVYGPGVGANFQSMMRWVSRGVPLPLGAIRNNRRSLVALTNLVDLLEVCTHHPNAANQTFLVSDGEDLSTSELLRRLGTALAKPARLVPVPPALLSTALSVIGKVSIGQRLMQSLQVDITSTCSALDWRPAIDVDRALKETANAFLKV